QEQPDVVLMDVRMPRVDGIEATDQILGLADSGQIRTPKIIVLTTFDDDEYALHALRAGASGFLLKDTLPEVLLDSIRTVVGGGASGGAGDGSDSPAGTTSRPAETGASTPDAAADRRRTCSTKLRPAAWRR